MTDNIVIHPSSDDELLAEERHLVAADVTVTPHAVQLWSRPSQVGLMGWLRMPPNARRHFPPLRFRAATGVGEKGEGEGEEGGEGWCRPKKSMEHRPRRGTWTRAALTSPGGGQSRTFRMSAADVQTRLSGTSNNDRRFVNIGTLHMFDGKVKDSKPPSSSAVFSPTA